MRPRADASRQLVQAGDKTAGIAVEADRQADHVVKRRVAKAPFDQADVDRVQHRPVPRPPPASSPTSSVACGPAHRSVADEE